MSIVKMPVFPGNKPIVVGKIYVKAEDAVKAGDPLLEAETGKGVKTIKAPNDAVIAEVMCRSGDTVAAGTEIIRMKDTEASVSKAPETTKQLDKKHCDILIIGGGPGGYVAAITAAQHHKHVIIAERSALGGTCLNVGCIPTKTLIKSGEVYAEMKQSDVFGIRLQGNAEVDMNAVIDRKEKVVSTLVSGVEYLMKKNQIEVIYGTAELRSSHEAVVAGKDKQTTIEAENVIIAIGSLPAKLNIEGIDLPCVMNSTGALSRRSLPASITIIGGGVIGMEFAFLYRNLGVQVNVIEFMDHLLGKMDAQASAFILQEAEKKGIHIHLSAQVKKIQEDDEHHAVVSYSKDGRDFVATSEIVLSAVGRVPNMEGINAEKLGLVLNERGRGIKVDSHMKTNLEGVYAIGDVTNIIQLAHAASYQGEIAVKDILSDAEADYTCVPSVVFVDPEVASVGLSEAEASAAEIEVSQFDFSANGKALSQGSGEGYVKLIQDKKENRLIGCTIVGPDASVLISIAASAIQNHLSAEQVAATIFPHPTTGEALKEAALGLCGGSIHA